MRRFRHLTKAALLALLTSAGALVIVPAAPAQVPPPTNTQPPAVDGTPREGSTLTEVPGFWSSQGGYSATVQWEECTDMTATNCTAIPNAPNTTGSSYTLGPGAVGSFIVVVETATNSGGSTEASSAPVGIVTTTSTTGLTVSPQPAVTNQSVTLVGTVTAGPGSAGPSGMIYFLDGGTPISGCSGIPVSPTGQAVTIACQTTFPASPAQLSATFGPNPGSAVTGSGSPVDVLSVSRDSTVTTLWVPNRIVAGVPTTFIAQVSPPAVRPGPREPTGSVEFFRGGEPIAGCVAQPIGPTGATCTTTYVSTGTRAITARYLGDGNFDPSPSSPRTARVVARARVASTMQWSFSFTPAYARVVALMLNGAAHTRVLVTCHGGGCPFARRVFPTTVRTRCRRKKHGRCRQTTRSLRTLNLAHPFGGRQLAAGARIAIAITRPGWIGKYYAFTIRPGSTPRIQISCLAPGATRPGKGC